MGRLGTRRFRGVGHKRGTSLPQCEQQKERRGRKSTLSPVYRGSPAWLRIGRPLQGWFKGLVVNYEGASTAFSRKALAMAGPEPPDSPMFVSPTRRFSLGEFCGATWAFALLKGDDNVPLRGR